MEPGDIIGLDITDVAHGGGFVGRHDGRVVFVPDAIPGERVRVRLTDLGHAAFWRGETIEVLDASPDRRPHIWRQADIDVAPEDRPGGADFGHIDLTAQLALKRRVVDQALRRTGGVEVPVSVGPAGSDENPDGTGWRTRLSLHVDDHGEVGPFAARSHRVIRVADHPLATAGLADAALAVTGGQPGRVDLVQPAEGHVRVIPRPHLPRGERPTAPNHAAREVVTERVGEREFHLDAGGFWQVHRLAAQALHDIVADSVRDRVDPDAWHLDLYGGVGLFAATLAESAQHAAQQPAQHAAQHAERGARARITSVESDRRASAHARHNLADHPRIRAENGRVDRWLRRLRAEATAADRQQLRRGVVVLDPPRSGAGRDVVESIVDLAPATVVYVACDPVALARDLKTFRAGGYETPRVDALDLFPHSHHVEAVAVLSRERPPALA